MENIQNIYNFFVVTLPNQIFPMENSQYHKLIFGDVSGISFYVILYFLISREILHFVGGSIFTFFSYELDKFKKGLDIILVIPLTLLILYQELYLHPHMYNQSLPKGILDIIFWLAPVYFYLYTRQKYINRKTVKKFLKKKNKINKRKKIF